MTVASRTETTSELKMGVLPWGQYTDWPSLQRAGQRADELGYDSLWTWDHLYPIQGDWRGPIFEGYLTLTGWAGVTNHVTVGLMVGANTFRNPALTTKMVTTLDHISGDLLQDGADPARRLRPCRRGQCRPRRVQ